MNVCWNITSKCNRNCRFCFREKNVEDLSLKDCTNILDNLLKIDISKITFAGGEPFMYKEIEKVIHEAKKRGIYTKIDTNAGLLNKDNIKRLLKNIDKIAFSIDSSNDEENYFLGRGTNHFEHIKELIPEIKKIYPNIKIEINTVLTSQTITGLDKLFESIKEISKNNEINRWKLIRFCSLREMNGDKAKKFELSDEEFNKVEEIFKNKKESFIITFVNNKETVNKNIVNQNGILEMVKNKQKVLQDLKTENISNIYKLNSTQNTNYLNTNLNLYKIFFQVAQYGSLSMASKKILISQPAISKSIKKLEDELDVKLFYRTINGMNLTDKGLELYKYVEDAYNTIKTGERSIIESSNMFKGKLSIGVPSHIASFYLFDKVKKFHNDYPQIEISVVSRSTADLIKLLENHEIDFIIDTSPIKGNEKILYIEELGKFPHSFIALKENNYNKKINKLRDLENYPLILPVERSSHRKRLNDYAENSDVKFNNVVSIETTEMIKEAIMQDVGIGYIIKPFVKRELDNNTLEEIKIGEELPYVTINLVYIDKYITNVPKLFIDEYLK